MSNLPDGYYLYKPDEKFGGALVRVRDGRHEILLMQGMEMLTVIRKNHIQPLRLEPVEPDAPITPAALREAGWTEDARGRLVLSIDLEYSLKRFSDGTVWIHFGKAAAPLFGCRSMSQLAALVELLTAAD